MQLTKSKDGVDAASPAPTAAEPEHVVAQRWSKIQQLVDQPYSPAPDAGVGAALASPPLTLLDANEMSTFGATPLEVGEGQSVVRCLDCSKPILESALAAHALNCQKIRERKSGGASRLVAEPVSATLKRELSQGTGSDSSASPTKKPKSSLVVSLGGAPIEAIVDAPKPKKKKDKDKSERVASGSNVVIIAPSSAAKDGSKKDKSSTRPYPFPIAAGEVDVEKQCGVITDKGYPCTRSLTCKTHSMGAKRSVPHRSQPYDILLHEWQKLTKPDFKNSKPVQPRVGPGSEAYGAGIGEGKKKKRSGGEGGAGTGRGSGETGKERRTRDKGKGLLIVGEWEESDAGEDEGLIDSEDEVESVLGVLQRLPHGRPLTMDSSSGGSAGFSTASLFAGRNSKLGRLREVLGGVFGGAGRPISGGTT
ncbi:SAGA-associated factor 73, partial [Phenoliferia sp. Uapishka_3]